MNTFEQEFGRSPTDEDFKIQAHVLETLVYVLGDSTLGKNEIMNTVKFIISELKYKTK